MNIIHHRSAWGIAVASAALALTTACGSEIATEAPANIGGAVDEQQSSPAPTRDTSQDFQGGSARPGRLPDAWN